MYDFVYKNLPKSLKKYHASDASVLKCSKLHKNKTFFYFGADCDMFLTELKSHKKAYEKMKNSGIGKTDMNGNANIYLKCPQIYKNTDGNVYPRHYHIFYWDEKKNQWDPKVYTYDYKCNVSTAMMKKDCNKFVVIKDKVKKDNLDKCKKTIAVLLCGTMEENEKKAKTLQKMGLMNVFFHNMSSKPSKKMGLKKMKGGDFYSNINDMDYNIQLIKMDSKIIFGYTQIVIHKNVQKFISVNKMFIDIITNMQLNLGNNGRMPSEIIFQIVYLINYINNQYRTYFVNLNQIFRERANTLIQNVNIYLCTLIDCDIMDGYDAYITALNDANPAAAIAALADGAAEIHNNINAAINNANNAITIVEDTYKTRFDDPQHPKYDNPPAGVVPTIQTTINSACLSANIQTATVSNSINDNYSKNVSYIYANAILDPAVLPTSNTILASRPPTIAGAGAGAAGLVPVVEAAYPLPAIAGAILGAIPVAAARTHIDLVRRGADLVSDANIAAIAARAVSTLSEADGNTKDKSISIAISCAISSVVKLKNEIYNVSLGGNSEAENTLIYLIPFFETAYNAINSVSSVPAGPPAGIRSRKAADALEAAMNAFNITYTINPGDNVRIIVDNTRDNFFTFDKNDLYDKMNQYIIRSSGDNSDEIENRIYFMKYIAIYYATVFSYVDIQRSTIQFNNYAKNSISNAISISKPYGLILLLKDIMKSDDPVIQIKYIYIIKSIYQIYSNFVPEISGTSESNITIILNTLLANITNELSTSINRPLFESQKIIKFTGSKNDNLYKYLMLTLLLFMKFPEESSCRSNVFFHVMRIIESIRDSNVSIGGLDTLLDILNSSEVALRTTSLKS